MKQKKRNHPIAMIIILFGIIILSLIPSINTNINLSNSDKFFHMLAYFALAVSIILSFHSKKTIIISLFVGFFISILLELVQDLIPGRIFSIFDIIANATGLISGAIIGLVFKNILSDIIHKLKLDKFFK